MTHPVIVPKLRLSLLLVLLVGMSVVAAPGVEHLLEKSRPRHALKPYHWLGAPSEALRVAWVGNSHTYVNQVPYLVQAMGDASGVPIFIEGIARPGFSLEQHRELGLFAAMLEPPLDVVVLQEQSAQSHYHPDRYARDAGYCAGLARALGARVVLVGAWAYEESPDHPERTPASVRAQERQSTEHVLRLSRRIAAGVAPVGLAFRLIREDSTKLDMTQRDGNHTTPEGAYLEAAVVYLAIAPRELSTEIVVPGVSIAPEIQATLWRVARQAMARIRHREGTAGIDVTPAIDLTRIGHSSGELSLDSSGWSRRG